jgi:hypothetical protein
MLLSESSTAWRASTFRAHSAHLGLLFNLREGGQEDEAADVTGSVGSVRGASQCRRSMCRKAQVGWVLPKIARQPVGLKKQLYMGAARWLCSGHRWLCSGASRTGQKRRPATQSEGSRPAPAAESRMPPQSLPVAPLAGSDDAETRWAASGGCGGFAQSCGRRRSFDRRRSDSCLRHPQGSGGRFARVRVRQMRHSLRGLAQPVIQSIEGECT